MTSRLRIRLRFQLIMFLRRPVAGLRWRFPAMEATKILPATEDIVMTCLRTDAGPTYPKIFAVRCLRLWAVGILSWTGHPECFVLKQRSAPSLELRSKGIFILFQELSRKSFDFFFRRTFLLL